MKAKDLVIHTLQGQKTPRVPCGPLAVHFCAADNGVSLERYTMEAATLAECVLRYHERYRPDAVWLSADTWVTAQAMGAPVAFPAPNQPLGGTHESALRSAADIDRIPPADPATLGRMPLMQSALRSIVEAIGNEVFVVACLDQAPFSLACALMGMNELMLKLVDDRPFVEALLERCIEHAVAYGEALARCGADMLSMGDSPAGLIGPERYREIALPAERRVFTALGSKTDRPLSLHICGDTAGILADMAASGANVLEIDHHVDLGFACEVIPEEVAIWGNLDPVGVLVNGVVEDVEQVASAAIETVRRYGRCRFVLSSGCTLAVQTPSWNLHALLRAAAAGDAS